jgi:hypothetical protein
MNDDEEQLIVMRGRGLRMLKADQFVNAQIFAIGQQIWAGWFGLFRHGFKPNYIPDREERIRNKRK